MKYYLLALLCSVSLKAICSSLRDTSFSEQPVSLKTATGELKGTLTLPNGGHAEIVALLLAGSGPTDRNGNAPGMTNNGLKMLAHALAGQGIASLRVDKRGIGESAGAMSSESDLRFDTYVQDATAWMEQLRKSGSYKKIIVIGHSEGSLIGMIAAQQGADAFISLSGAGQPADKILKTQLAAQPKPVQDLCYPMIDTLKQGHLLTSVDPSLYALFRPSVQPYLISWFKYDPVGEIKKLHVPILIIQGTNDLQITTADAQALSDANPGAKLVLIDHMNHVLKKVADDRTSNLAAYNDPALPLDSQLVAAVIQFIQALK